MICHTSSSDMEGSLPDIVQPPPAQKVRFVRTSSYLFLEVQSSYEQVRTRRETPEQFETRRIPDGQGTKAHLAPTIVPAGPR